MFVLGVDPGLTRCGYCVIETRQEKRHRLPAQKAVALGVIRTSADDALPNRLCELQDEFRSLMDEFSPDVVVLERVLFQVNVRTAMSVGQASGIVMAEAARRQCQVEQYSPNEVKLAVTGYGAADKIQVQTMVQTLLGLEKPPTPFDAADAAALALCHIAMAPWQYKTEMAIQQTVQP